MPDETLEFDNTAFVVYVPPNSALSDPTSVESCIRLGAGPTSSTADEEKTYRDIVSKADALSGLSASTYNTTPGIALLTPGSINLVAAGGVNTTCGSYTHSTIGSSYVVTQDAHSDGTPGHVISAAYTSEDARGTWVTSSFNQALTVGVNTVPLQASIGLGASYSIAGPLSLSNSWGAIWNSTAGWAVSVQLARSVAIGLCSVVVTDANGSTNAYYTEAQGSNTGQQFKWVVPVPTKYEGFNTMQGIYCKVVVAVSVAVGLVAEVYAMVGAATANKSNKATPGEMKAWLDKAEGIAIACTVADSLAWAAGIVLGFLTDNQLDDDEANSGATAITIKNGNIELTTATPDKKNSVPSPTLTVDKDAGIALTTRVTPNTGASITVNRDEIKITATKITFAGDVKFGPLVPDAPPAAPSPPSPPPESAMSKFLKGLQQSKPPYTDNPLPPAQ